MPPKRRYSKRPRSVSVAASEPGTSRSALRNAALEAGDEDKENSDPEADNAGSESDSDKSYTSEPLAIDERVGKAGLLPGTVLPPDISEADAELFKKAQKIANQAIGANSNAAKRSKRTIYPKKVQLGKFLISSWYSSPYPDYSKIDMLYICEFCLDYINSKTVLTQHMGKCPLRHPPGTEIYRDGDLSIFEVDGKKSRVYTQNLCLIAKMFLDNKTLFYDVEGFLFYVVTKNDPYGCHIVGYFSKEKESLYYNNVSCIMTLPQFQRKGYGRLMIEFSYLLTRIQGTYGTPETPLSDLGRMSYEAYWKTCILDFFHKTGPTVTSVSVDEVMKATGMTSDDVASTVIKMGFVKRIETHTPDGMRFAIWWCVDWKLVDKHAAKEASNQSRLRLHPENLKWVPTGQEDEEDEEDEDEEAEEGEEAVKVEEGEEDEDVICLD